MKSTIESTKIVKDTGILLEAMIGKAYIAQGRKRSLIETEAMHCEAKSEAIRSL